MLTTLNGVQTGGFARFFRFLLLVFVLTSLMFLAWIISAWFLPSAVLRPYFARLFSWQVGELSFSRILLVNLFPFLGVQFMNLFRVNGRPGGLYVLPIFWILVGVLYGTNSFVYAGEPIPFSLAVLGRTGFNELLAYTLGYEASRSWAVWKQQGLWQVEPLPKRRWKPSREDAVYWVAGLLALIVAAAREVM